MVFWPKAPIDEKDKKEPPKKAPKRGNVSHYVFQWDWEGWALRTLTGQLIILKQLFAFYRAMLWTWAPPSETWRRGRRMRLPTWSTGAGDPPSGRAGPRREWRAQAQEAQD